MTWWHGRGNRWGYDFGQQGAMTYLLNDDDEKISSGYHEWTYAGQNEKGQDTFHASVGSSKFEITVWETNRDGLATTEEPANNAAERKIEQDKRTEKYGLSSLVDDIDML